jgi:NADH-quinone oxidoreductase subunit M
VAAVAPGLARAFMITMLASIGLPMLNNFVGEFLVLQGAALADFKWAVFAAIGVILSACYMLWLYQRVFFGRASADLQHHMYDLNLREWACIVPLIVMMVWMGCFTQSFMPSITTSTAGILEKTRTNLEIHVRRTPPARSVLEARVAR